MSVPTKIEQKDKRKKLEVTLKSTNQPLKDRTNVADVKIIES